jgi:hypothetical protein
VQPHPNKDDHHCHHRQQQHQQHQKISKTSNFTRIKMVKKKFFGKIFRGSTAAPNLKFAHPNFQNSQKYI